MSNITVKQERIKHLMDTATYSTQSFFKKCTVVVAQLENGFVLTASSACVDPDNYDHELGIQLCRQKIEDKLWELEGYALQKAVYEKGDK